MNSDEAARRRPDSLSRRSLDAVVILPPNQDVTVTLVGRGVAVWELLAEWRSVDAVVTLLAGAVTDDPAVDVVRREVTAAFDTLERAGALDRADE